MGDRGRSKSRTLELWGSTVLPCLRTYIATCRTERSVISYKSPPPAFSVGCLESESFWCINLSIAETNDGVLKIINARASWAEVEVCYLFISFIYTLCLTFQESSFCSTFLQEMAVSSSPCTSSFLFLRTSEVTLIDFLTELTVLYWARLSSTISEQDMRRYVLCGSLFFWLVVVPFCFSASKWHVEMPPDLHSVCRCPNCARTLVQIYRIKNGSLARSVLPCRWGSKRAASGPNPARRCFLTYLNPVIKCAPVHCRRFFFF